MSEFDILSPQIKFSANFTSLKTDLEKVERALQNVTKKRTITVKLGIRDAQQQAIRAGDAMKRSLVSRLGQAGRSGAAAFKREFRTSMKGFAKQQAESFSKIFVANLFRSGTADGISAQLTKIIQTSANNALAGVSLTGKSKKALDKAMLSAGETLNKQGVDLTSRDGKRQQQELAIANLMKQGTSELQKQLDLTKQKLEAATQKKAKAKAKVKLGQGNREVDAIFKAEMRNVKRLNFERKKARKEEAEAQKEAAKKTAEATIKASTPERRRSASRKLSVTGEGSKQFAKIDRRIENLQRAIRDTQRKSEKGLITTSTAERRLSALTQKLRAVKREFNEETGGRNKFASARVNETIGTLKALRESLKIRKKNAEEQKKIDEQNKVDNRFKNQFKSVSRRAAQLNDRTLFPLKTFADVKRYEKALVGLRDKTKNLSQDGQASGISGGLYSKAVANVEKLNQQLEKTKSLKLQKEREDVAEKKSAERTRQRVQFARELRSVMLNIAKLQANPPGNVKALESRRLSLQQRINDLLTKSFGLRGKAATMAAKGAQAALDNAVNIGKANAAIKERNRLLSAGLSAAKDFGQTLSRTGKAGGVVSRAGGLLQGLASIGRVASVGAKGLVALGVAGGAALATVTGLIAVFAAVTAAVYVAYKAFKVLTKIVIAVVKTGLKVLTSTVIVVGKALAKLGGKIIEAVVNTALETMGKAAQIAAAGFNALFLPVSNLIRGFRQLASYAPVISAIGTIQLGRKAVESVLEFDDAITRLNISLGNLGTGGVSELNALNVQITNLAKDYVFSATEVAKAADILARAGLSAQEIFQGQTLEATLDLALTGGGTIEDAAATIIAAANTFGRSGQEIIGVVDGIRAASLQAQVEVSDIAQTVKNAGFVFREANIPFETLLASATQLGKQGLSGERAGTALRRGATDLLSATKKDLDLLNRLIKKGTGDAGATLKDFLDEGGGRFRDGGFVDLLDALEKAKVGTKEIQDLLGARGQLFLGLFGSGGIAGLRNSIRLIEIAQELKLSKKQADTLQGSLASMFKIIKAIGDTIVQNLFNPFREIATRTVQKVVDKLNEVNESLSSPQVQLFLKNLKDTFFSVSASATSTALQLAKWYSLINAAAGLLIVKFVREGLGQALKISQKIINTLERVTGLDLNIGSFAEFALRLDRFIDSIDVFFQQAIKVFTVALPKLFEGFDLKQIGKELENLIEAAGGLLISAFEAGALASVKILAAGLRFIIPSITNGLVIAVKEVISTIAPAAGLFYFPLKNLAKELEKATTENKKGPLKGRTAVEVATSEAIGNWARDIETEFGTPLDRLKDGITDFTTAFVKGRENFPDLGSNFANFSQALNEIGLKVAAELRFIFSDFQSLNAYAELFYQKGIDFFTRGIVNVSGFINDLTKAPIKTLKDSFLIVEQGLRRVFDSFLRKQPRREVEDIGQASEASRQQASLISAASFFNSVQGARMTAGERAIVDQLKKNDVNAANRQRAAFREAQEARDEDKGILFQAGQLLGNVAGFDFGG